jgi:AcrR family transcriptional regulator
MKNSTRPPLDRQRIARTALALIDEKGIDHLTMRSIGAALDVEAMSLYHYFKNKAELLDGVKDFLLDELVLRVDAGDAPVERIKSTFQHLRQIALEHPDITPTLGASTFRTPRAMAFFEELIGLFYAAGLDSEQSARYYGLLSQYTLGCGLFAVGAYDQTTTPVLDAHNAALFPGTDKVMPYAALAYREANYQFGIGLILNAMRAESQ